MTWRTFLTNPKLAECTTCDALIDRDSNECRNCGIVLIGANWLRNPLAWLTVLISGVSVYSALVYALIRVWHQ